MECQEQEVKFKQMLADFLVANGVIPNTDWKPQVSPAKLYKLVCRHGGFQAISNRDEWGRIAGELKSTAKVVKLFYQIYLHKYERDHYFEQECEEEFPNLIASEPNKNKHGQIKPKPEDEDLLSSISRSIEEEDRAQKQFYLNKSKLSSSKVESKKILLGLQPYMARKDLIYSLNMLLLYSANSHSPFLFETHQKIFSALSNYTHSLYPPANEQSLQDLRTITLILRNLTMNPINLKYMLGSPFFQLLVTIFNNQLDSECSRNIVDIMSGLVKVGWDCDQILKEIGTALLDGKFEDAQHRIELLKGLIDERDQGLAAAIVRNIQVVIRILISTEVNVDAKEQILQVLAFVTDINLHSREEFLKNSIFLSILISILQYMRNQEKMSQFAALTLSNMSNAVDAKYYLKAYESELVAIGFTDDSLAGIIANILSDIASI